MRIWFVRHGETLFNRLRRFQGQCDAPLTEKGIHDAERARDALKDTVFTKAFCSYSGRAEDTARIILEGRGIEPVREKQLSAVSAGRIPAWTRGATSATKPLAWQPGFAIREAFASFSR